MVFLVFLIILSYNLVKPFITSILTSLVLAYVFYPFYKFLGKWVKNKNINAFIVTILVIVVIFIPSFFILNTVLIEAYNLYPTVKQIFFEQNAIFNTCGEDSDITCRIVESYHSLISNANFKYYLDNTIKEASGFFIEELKKFIISVPNIFLNVFVVLFILFFGFRDGKDLINKIACLLPLKQGHRKEVLKKFNDVTFAVIYGTILVSIIQGAVGGLGFFIVGIRNPVLWGIIMMFFALLPFLGTSLIWFPASIILMISGFMQSSNLLIIKGFLLLLFGLFVVSLIDNFLKPKIIGDRAKVHPALILLGVFGGLKIMGFIGIIVGPIILALLVSFVKFYEEEDFI